jgi:hypothetical protein
MNKQEGGAIRYTPGESMGCIMEEIWSYVVGVAGIGLLLALIVLVSAPFIRRRWNSSVFGNTAQIASAIIGFVGFAVVILQLHENRAKAAAEAYRAELADARRLYVTYSASALEHPELAEPDYDSLMHDRWKYVRYKTFVAHMLWAYDDMLNVIETRRESDALNQWFASLEADVKTHLRYICQEVSEEYLRAYTPALKRYLRRAEGDACKDQKPLP